MSQCTVLLLSLILASPDVVDPMSNVRTGAVACLWCVCLGIWCFSGVQEAKLSEQRILLQHEEDKVAAENRRVLCGCRGGGGW